MKSNFNKIIVNIEDLLDLINQVYKSSNQDEKKEIDKLENNFKIFLDYIKTLSKKDIFTEEELSNINEIEEAIFITRENFKLIQSRG